MESSEKDGLIIIRLFRGEDIMEGMEEACKKHDVTTAIALMGIGQLRHIQLGYFRTKGDYVKQSFDQPHELLSLSGNVSKQPEGYNFHLHTALGDIVKNVRGGHLIKAEVTVTAEIALLKADIPIVRREDPETGLAALHF